MDELNIESAKSLSNQGIDVFNPKDDFFNDLCHKYDNPDGKDVIIFTIISPYSCRIL